MKKLNKKGFTLIELLAVIVILAIIVVVTVPTILNSINDARLSSLHSLSKEVANQYDTLLAQDQLAAGSNKVLGTAVVPDDGEWHCLKDLTKGSDSLFEILGLSENDIVKNGTSPTNESFVEDGSNESGYYYEPGANGGLELNNMCSAIKLVNNRAWVILISTDTGKFKTDGKYRTYAASFGSNAYNEGV